MLRKLFLKTLNLLGKVLNKKILYFPENVAVNNLTAVKSTVGFWYAGNILDTSDIAYGVLYNGIVEKDGTNLVINLLKKLQRTKENLVFYDIGANTGYFGILAAYLGNRKIHTYSFEPLEKYNLIEKETIKLNNLEKDCEIFNLALGETNGESKIFLAGSGSSLSVEFLGDRYKKLESVTVSVQKLDDYVILKNIQEPDFIKMDVEGFELQVLKGGSQLIKKSLPVIWYESALTDNENNVKNNNFYLSQNLLKGMGYKVFLCGKELEEVNNNKTSDGISMYLALHETKHLEILKNLKSLYAKN